MVIKEFTYKVPEMSNGYANQTLFSSARIDVDRIGPDLAAPERGRRRDEVDGGQHRVPADPLWRSHDQLRGRTVQ